MEQFGRRDNDSLNNKRIQNVSGPLALGLKMLKVGYRPNGFHIGALGLGKI